MLASKFRQPALRALLENHGLSRISLILALPIEYSAQATTMAPSRVIDVVATRRRHARMIKDVHCAFFYLVEDES